MLPMIDHQSILHRMEIQIQAWEKTSDRRSIFLRCYSMMTQNMLAAIETGEFRDPLWVSALLNHFADYYFQALEAYERDLTTAPAVWARVHEAARDLDTQVLQNLILGVNAHINYDLVLTLVDMLRTKWPLMDLEHRQLRYADYTHVNKIIGHTTDAVQERVVETLVPTMGLVDKLLGPFDEWIISELITRWRDEVWQHAISMLETANPEQWERQRETVEVLTLERASAILFEGGLNNLTHFI